MTHAADKFDWGAVYYRGIALGYDNGYAAYRADKAEQRWLRRRQGECPSGTTSKPDTKEPDGSSGESHARRIDPHIRRSSHSQSPWRGRSMSVTNPTSNEITPAEMIEQARKWPRDGFGEGRWFHAMADEIEAVHGELRKAMEQVQSLCKQNERLSAALERERQRYMSLADRQAKRGKDEAAQEFWDKAEAISEVLKS